MSISYSDAIDLLTLTVSEKSAGVTVDTTGTGFDVSKRQQIVIQFVGAGIVAGNGVFTVDASNDNSNWITGIAVQDLTSTSPATYVTSKTINATGSVAVKVPAGFRYIRANVDVTTDGTYYAFMECGG